MSHITTAAQKWASLRAAAPPLPYSGGVVASFSPTAFENYFKEQMKIWCYEKAKRLFYEKYNCYGFYQRTFMGFPTPDNEPIFCYCYEYDQYKQHVEKWKDDLMPGGTDHSNT